MPSKTVLLIRHPETDWNRQRRYQGRTGRPLTGRGEASVAELIAGLRRRGIDRVVASPVSHARVAATRIAAGAGLGPGPRLDDGWREIDHGTWEGLLHDEVAARYGCEAGRRFGDPHYDGHGGETVAEVDARVGRAWRALLDGPGMRIAVVTHATPIRMVLCLCLGLPWSAQWRFRVDHATVTRIDVADGSVMVGAVNCGVAP